MVTTQLTNDLAVSSGVGPTDPIAKPQSLGQAKGMPPSRITCLFVDIGGVLLSDGWDHVSRRSAALKFGIEYEEMETRHRQAFEAYETDRIDLRTYLNLVVFNRARDFTPNEFQRFMFERSTPFPDMISLIRDLRMEFKLKVVVVSNEARELNLYRIEKFGLRELVDSFVSSSFVHLRKPDPDIFRLALDLVNVSPDETVYIENTPMFVEVAANLGIPSILHRDHASTCKELRAFGLEPSENLARQRT